MDSLKDYALFEETIKRCSLAWWHHLNYTWLIKTSWNAKQLFKELYPCLNANEAGKGKILIVRIASANNAEVQGFLPPEAWKWLNEYNV